MVSISYRILISFEPFLIIQIISCCMLCFYSSVLPKQPGHICTCFSAWHSKPTLLFVVLFDLPRIFKETKRRNHLDKVN